MDEEDEEGGEGGEGERGGAFNGEGKVLRHGGVSGGTGSWDRLLSESPDWISTGSEEETIQQLEPIEDFLNHLYTIITNTESFLLNQFSESIIMAQHRHTESLALNQY